MHALNINLLPRRRAPSLVALALLVLGAVGMVTVAQNYSDAQDELDQLALQHSRADRAARRARAESAPAPRSAASSARKGDDGQAVARMQNQLELPWYPVLQALEAQAQQAAGANAAPSVALLQLDLAAQAGTVRLIAEAKTMDDALHYVSGLQQLPQLRDVVLLSHEEKTLGAATVIRFTVSADWGARHE